MGAFLSFVVGVIVGLIIAWWFFERRDSQNRESIEAGWKKKLEHVEKEVQRADAAHEETKQRLIEVQQQRPTTKPAPAPSAETAPSGGAPAAPSAGTNEVDRKAQARRRIDAKLAQLPAGSSARKRLLAERAALDGGDTMSQPQPQPPQEPQGDEPEMQRLFETPTAEPDDLERIRGIGPVLKGKLNKLGITTFAQIAAFTDDDMARVDEVLDFKGRIAREGWVEQAKELSAGN